MGKIVLKYEKSWVVVVWFKFSGYVIDEWVDFRGSKIEWIFMP